MAGSIADMIKQLEGVVPSVPSIAKTQAGSTLLGTQRSALGGITGPSPATSPIAEQIQRIAAGEGKKPGGFAGIVGSVLNLPGVKQVLAPLSVLDIPRRAVISAGKEIWDVFGSGDASWGDFAKQVKDPSFGFGKFVHTGNKWLDRTLGFIGDVAFDPMTYVSLGSKHLGSFGQRLAASGKLLDTGADAGRAAKLVREGSWFLSEAERANIGARRAGVYFMGKRIAGTGRAGSILEHALSATRLGIGDSALGEVFRKAFTPLQFKEAQLALKRGLIPTEEGARNAIRTILSRDAVQAAQNAALEANTRSLEKVAAGARQMNGVELTRIAENPALLAQASPDMQRVVNAGRAWYDTLHTQVDNATRELTDGAQGVGYTKDYVSRIMTGEGRSYASKTESLANELGISRAELAKPGVFEARVLEPGKKFFGYELKDSDMSISRLNEIANEAGFQGKFFEDDYFKILGGYATQHAREMGRIARFDYLKKNGVLNFVDQKIAADAGVIAQKVKDAVVPLKNVKDSMNRLGTALNDISEATAKGLRAAADNAKTGLGKSNTELIAARQAQSAAVREVIDAAGALRKAGESVASMFDPTDGIDLGLVDSLTQKIDEVTASIQKRVDDFFAGTAEQRTLGATVTNNNEKIAALQDVLDTVNAEMEVLSNNLYTSMHIHEILNTNINAMIDGKTLPISTKALREGDKVYEAEPILGAAQAKIENAAKGGGAARGRPTKAAQAAKDAELRRVKTGIQSRVTESEWAKGVANIHPFQKSKVYEMTDVRRADILSKVANGAVTASDLNNVAMNIIARNEEFILRMGATLPPELQSLQDELVGQLKELANVRKTIRTETARVMQGSRKVASLEEKASGVLGQLYDEQGVYDDLLRAKDKLETELEKLRATDGVDGATILRREKKLDKIERAIEKSENKVFYVGEGATQKAYGIRKAPGFDYRAAETLPAKIGTPSELELQIQNLGRTEIAGSDVLAVQRGKRKAVAQAAIAGKANAELTRRMARTMERYYVSTEVWRRATAISDSLAEIGLVADENMLRKIARSVANERSSIWFERADRAFVADTQLYKLEAIATTAAETGNWKPLGDAIAEISKSKENSIIGELFKDGDAVLGKDAQFVTGAWADYESAKRFAFNVKNKTKVREAYDIATANREMPINDIQRGARAAALESQIAAEGRLTTFAQAKKAMQESSDSIIKWYQQNIGDLPKGTFKTIQGNKVLTVEGEEFLKKFIGAKFDGTSADATRFLAVARQIIEDEKKLTRQMRLMFTGMNDPDANVFAILTGGAKGDTPLGMSLFYRREAERIKNTLNQYYGLAAQRNVLRGETGATTRSLTRARAEELASTTGENIDQFNTMRAQIPAEINNPETYGQRAAAARREALLPYAEGQRTAALDKAVRDRFAVNQQLGAIKGSGEYDLALTAQRRYEVLDKMAGHSLANVDLGAIAGTTPGTLILSPVEWESLFIADLSQQAVKDARAVTFEIQNQIVDKQTQLENLVPNGRAAKRVRDEIDSLTQDLERAQLVLDAHNKGVRNGAIRKLEDVLGNAARNFESPDEFLAKLRSAGSKTETAGLTKSRRMSLKAGWDAANERRLLQKVDDLAASAGAITTRSVKDEVKFLERRLFGVGTEENPSTWSLLWRLEDTTKKTGEAIGSARRGVEMLAQPTTAQLTDSASKLMKGTIGMSPADVAKLTPSQIEEIAGRAAKAGRLGEQSATMRLQNQKTVLSKIPGWEEAQRVAIDDLKSSAMMAEGNIAMLQAQNKRLAAALKQTAKYTDNGEFSMSKLFEVINPKSKLATQRNTLQSRLDKTINKISETADGLLTQQEAAAKRFAEAEAALGVARNTLVSKQQMHALNVSTLNERMRAVDDFLAKMPKKITNPRDAEAVAELRDFSDRARALMGYDAENQLDKLWADAEIANNVLMQNMDRAADAQDIIAAARRGEVGGNVLPVIEEGWMRLGGYSDEELAALKAAKKSVKDKAAKAAFKPAPVFEAGFPGMQIPKEVGDWMTSLTRELGTPGKQGAFLNFLGEYTNFFKAYATLSPGFHVRNGLSNIFSVLSADASLVNMRKAQKLWRRYVEDPERWLAGLSREEATKAELALKAMYASGGGRIDDAVTEFMNQGSNRIYNNWLVRKSQKVGHKIESTHRFWLAYDSIEKGMDMSQASARVRRYLFDYHNPNAVDEAVRKVVPFWTWMSRNLPLQLVNRWSNPRAYAMYNSFVRNYGQSTEGMAVPGYWTEQGAFRIGGNTFLQPDLGFNRINQQLAEFGQPNRLLSYVNPLLRVPFELTGNTKLYSNQPFSGKPVKLSGPLSALEPVLALLGQTSKDAQGNTVVSDKALYGLMNLLPPVSTGERLFPSTEQYGTKQLASWLSFLGAPVRQYTNDVRDRELWARNYALQDYVQQQKNLGTIK